MKMIVLNGTLSEAEQDLCLKKATEKYPAHLIENLYLNVQGDSIEIRCELHRTREMRKMSGYCIGCPEDWNPAKQAELRDTVPNPI